MWAVNCSRGEDTTWPQGMWVGCVLPLGVGVGVMYGVNSLSEVDDCGFDDCGFDDVFLVTSLASPPRASPLKSVHTQ